MYGRRINRVHCFCARCYGDPLREFVSKTFVCSCGLEQTVTHKLGHGDSLDHHCPECGEYFKKSTRIPEMQIIRYEYFELEHPPCP